MGNTLFSSTWYRVSELKPRIRSHIRVIRHDYRGQDWFVLADHLTGRYHRISRQAYHVVGLMDGNRSLAKIWEAACTHLEDDMPTQDEVIALLANLHRTDILMADIPPDTRDLYKRYAKERTGKIVNTFRSPMSVKIPILDPDRLLRFVKPVTDLIVSRFFLMVWLAVVISAVVTAVIHFSELTQNITDTILGAENILILWFAYPVIKIIHEFGHACAVKRWGGEVHEIGIMFLVLMPIPYVDASSSLSFANKWKRIVVSAAGILVELFLAAIAVFVWVHAEPGLVRSLAFNIILIASVSTVLFNGNPLLKFDSYYILSDLLEIPNLGTRSNRYIGYLIKKHLLRVSQTNSPAASAGEAFWLGLYAPASFVYKIFISLRIALYVAGKFFFVGFLLAVWATGSMFVIPVVTMVQKMMHDNQLSGKKGYITVLSVLFLIAAAYGFCAVPVRYAAVSEGVVQIPEQSMVFVGADGFVREIYADSGIVVSPGTPLIRLENPEVDVQVAIKQAVLKELAARLDQAGQVNLTESDILKNEIKRITGELDRDLEKRDALLVKSHAAGTFILPDENQLIGRFLHQGMPAGYVIDYSKITVQVVISQSDANLVRKRAKRVLVRLAGNVEAEFEGDIVREVPAASHTLPSMALSLEGGGSIALDPREREAPKTFENYFQFEIRMKDGNINRIGERAHVKFELEPEPLFFRVYRYVRRVFMSRFDI